MKIGSVKYSHAEEVLRRTYPDGKTSSQALLAHVDWKVEAGEKIESKAFRSFGLLEVPPGGVIAAHTHVEREEIYYILSGAGILKTGEQETRLREGMSVWFPANVEHSVSNPHKGSLRILFATAFI